VRVLHDVPGLVPVTIRWRQRTWRCPDAGCPVGVFVEQHPDLVRPRGSLTCRAVTWAIAQLRHEHATIAGLARRLGTTWKTLWRAVRPRLEALADDEARLGGVVTLGVDEHVWHHTPHKSATKGPTMLTGMVDLTRDSAGTVHARLLDLVPGRSGTVFAAWLQARGAGFRAGVKVATLDPFRGYANALRDELSEATPVLDAFHVVKLAAQAMDAVRRRVQQDTLGHRGHAGDPLFRIRNILHRAAGDLTERQRARLTDCLERGDPDDEVLVAWQCYQQVRSAYATGDLAAGKEIAERVVATFASCPIGEIARLGRTLRQWKNTYLGYFTTERSNNGGTEAINGVIELHRRIARGYRNRDNYRLRMLLVAGGLDPRPLPEVR
jgi:transposase